MKSRSFAAAAAALLVLSSFANADPTPTPVPTAQPTPEAPLRELGSKPSPTPVAVVTVNVQKWHDDDDDNRVAVGDSLHIRDSERVPGNAVTVFGRLTVDGEVDGNAVTIFGSSDIEGTVHGNAVCVFGAMHLGPHAHIDGNLVCAPGVEHSEEGAYIGGHVVKGGDMGDHSDVVEWWNRGILRGRPLFIGHGIHLMWFVTLFSLGLSVLLALMFPRGVQRCGAELVTRPGITILTGFMGMVGIPILFILLLATFVGIPVAIFVLPLAAFIVMVFGRTAVFFLVGQPIVRAPEHPAVAVLVGAVIVVLFLLVPLLGLMVLALVDFLGFSCALAALFAQRRAPAGPPPAPPAAPTPPPAASAAATSPAPAPVDPANVEAAQPAAGIPLLVPPAVSTSAPPPLAHASETALPRAGFWIRILAIFIDCILVGIVTRMHDLFPLILAVYCTILWKLRGATIGDIILGLKVVRTDGAPIDWVTALVRALACFFSVVVVGLGFIWIAFDREKQGWHDKIAGTYVVQHPRGVSLV